MGKGIRSTDEFKQEAVNQVVVHGYNETYVDIRQRRVTTLNRFRKQAYHCKHLFSR